jgi:hypothetical protein
VSQVQVELVCKYEEQDNRSQVNIVKVKCVRHIEYSTLGFVGVHLPIDELPSASYIQGTYMYHKNNTSWAWNIILGRIFKK